MIRAVSARPTKETASISGSSRIAVTASRPPWTRLTTPAGISSTESTISAISTDGLGSCSEGLRMNVLPQAIA